MKISSVDDCRQVLEDAKIDVALHRGVEVQEILDAFQWTLEDHANVTLEKEGAVNMEKEREEERGKLFDRLKTLQGAVRAVLNSMPARCKYRGPIVLALEESEDE